MVEQSLPGRPDAEPLRGAGRRVLIYSHDTFGLGHLRRCREIGHALTAAHDDISVLILSGSPIIGSFDFRSRVDFVRVPGVIKLRDGAYTSLNLPIGIEETLAIRASIIQHTAEVFDPDLFIVDKEPLGLRGEIEGTLELMRARGVPCVLGLRDVIDEPELLAPEWERKHAVPAVVKFYDEVWVYGLPQICDPLEGIEIPASVKRKTVFTGYLRRSADIKRRVALGSELIERPFILVTPGGGGDGEGMVDWVLRAYEENEDALPLPAIIVLGPFMAAEKQAEFVERASELERVEAITFEANLETLMLRAEGVVAMGGYNTFCEILSFDKRSLIVPRTVPRREQLIRAERGQELGLVSVLVDDGRRDAKAMITALKQLPQQPVPSDAVVPGLLDGHENVVKLAEKFLYGKAAPVLSVRHGSL